MTTQPKSFSVDKAVHTTTIAYAKPVGHPIGTNKFGVHYWELEEIVQNYFHSHVKPEILQYLNGLLGSVSTPDSIIIVAYMAGRIPGTAKPTVLFVSKNSSQRKDARKLTKECGILNKHPGWVTAEASRDPGWGAPLRTLALGRGGDASGQTHQPVSEVFYDPSRSLRSGGMTIYVAHGPSLRVATANLIRVHGQTFYLTAAHAFFDRNDTAEDTADEYDDDSDLDSFDGDTSMYSDGAIDEPVTELCRAQAFDDYPSSSDSTEFEPFSPYARDNEDICSLSSFGSTMLMGIGGAVVNHGSAYGASSQTFETGFEATPSEDSEDDKFSGSIDGFFEDPAVETSTELTLNSKAHLPSLASLRPLGILSRWSVDKDWALVAVTGDGNPELATFLAADQEDLSTLPLAQSNIGGGLVHTYTTSGEQMTGTMLSTVSDYRPPYGTSFQEVFSVRIDGCLADGDCGSAVTDAATGELYGHIVAGCPENGFAYVMAARHVFPDLQKEVSPATAMITTPPDNKVSEEQTSNIWPPPDTKNPSPFNPNATNAILNSFRLGPWSSYIGDGAGQEICEQEARLENVTYGTGKKPNIPQNLQKVEVLMIHWEDPIGNTHSEEIERLRHVFEKFGFGCDDVKLSMYEADLQSSLNHAVSRYVSIHDDPNKLLIVYYTGHGLEDLYVWPKRRRLYGPISKLRRNDSNFVSWNVAEAPLLSASADVVTIVGPHPLDTTTPTVAIGRKVYERLSFDETSLSQYGMSPVSLTRALRETFEALLEEGQPSLTASKVQQKLFERAQISFNLYRPLKLQRKIRWTRQQEPLHSFRPHRDLARPQSRAASAELA